MSIFSTMESDIEKNGLDNSSVVINGVEFKGSAVARLFFRVILGMKDVIKVYIYKSVDVNDVVHPDDTFFDFSVSKAYVIDKNDNVFMFSGNCIKVVGKDE